MKRMIRNNVERLVVDDAVEKMKAKGFKVIGEEVETSIAPTEEPVVVAQGISEEGEQEKAIEVCENKETDVNYSNMTVEELRKIAKANEIQGYYNMNKDTLVAVITELV